MGNTLKAVVALGTSLVRLGRGAVATGNRSVPSKTLELYDCENDAECRPVREALTMLDLEVMVYPVPGNGKRFRKQLAEKSGSNLVPFLHDPNTGECSSRVQKSIVDYLYSPIRTRGRESPDEPVTACIRLQAVLARKQGDNTPEPGKAPEQAARALLFRGQPLCASHQGNTV